jgi:1-acyl-sn-glycerol-3-phosphate acyltransferase
MSGLRRLYGIIRRLIVNARVEGAENLRIDEPVILVANHAGALGPVAVITSLPIDVRPWVTNEITDLETAAPRIQAELLEQEMHLRPPLSAFLGRIIARICVALMRDIGAIPVYRNSRRMRGTLQGSSSLLERGKSILVFAEDSTRKINEALCEFCTGFAHLARMYYEKTHKAVSFLPVAINRRARGIRIGAPIRFDASRPFPMERQRLKSELEATVLTLYRELEDEADHRGRRSA